MCVATYSKLACLLLALDSILGYALPVEPVSGLNAASLLERDAGDSPDDPIDIFIDCTGQEVICDADCYAVLCAGKPHVLQRDATDANTHRTQSGQAVQPFNADPDVMLRRGVTRINDIFTSPEEYPYASSSQGGTGAVLAGVPVNQQSQQGRALNAAFAASNVLQGQWYRNNWQSTTGYCAALNANPRDVSVCENKNPPDGGYDWTSNMYTRAAPKGQFITFQLLGSILKGGKRDADAELNVTVPEAAGAVS